MAETTGSKERQQNQQAYKDYLEQLQAQRKQSGMKSDTLEALDNLRDTRSPQPTTYVKPKPEEPQPSTYDDPEETKMREFQKKVAPVQTWGSIAGMPLIAKDSFAPMFSGTKFASNARDYMFNRRMSLMQRNARVDKDEAARLVGRVDSDAAKGMSSSELTNLARDKYFSRMGAPLSESEAVRFAKMGIADKAGKVGGVKEAQRQYLGMDPNENHFGFTMNRMVKEKALKDFEARQTGVRSSVGKVLYGNNSERQGVLKNMPIDLSSDTAAGQVAQTAGHALGATATALPAFSVGLGSAANYQKLQNLRKDRHITGKSGKVAETGLSMAQIIRAGMFAPAATMMAAPAFSAMTKGAGFLGGKAVQGAGDVLGLGAKGIGHGVGNVIEGVGGMIPGLGTISQGLGAIPKFAGDAVGGSFSAMGGAGDMAISGASNLAGNVIQAGGQTLYRGAKDHAMGMTSMMGTGALKGASGLANLLGIGGGNVDLGASLAGAAKGVGAGATMAGLAPALIGGLGLALPGIIGGVSGHMADKKRRIMRGFKQPTDKLVKQFSRSRGIDGVIRNLFSTNEITSDRMLELQLLMYIEQNTSSIPKMVSDTGLILDRKEKDSNATVDEYQGMRDSANEGTGTMGARMGRGAKYAWSRGLIGMQELAHTINIPGQLADFFLNKKSPWARKEEFRQAKEDALFDLKAPGHTKKIAGMLGTSASHVKLLSMPATMLIRQSGAESADAQQVALQAGIFDLLRYQFALSSKTQLKGTGLDLRPDSSVEEMTGLRKFLHKIPGISSFVSAYDTGNKIFDKGKGAFNYIKNFKDNIGNADADIGDFNAGSAGGQRTGLGRWLSSKIMGKEQLAQFQKGTEVKREMGLFKTDPEKLQAFNLKLPDLWAELLHLNRISVDALHNIFNVGNKMLSMTGQGIQFQGSGSEQKQFDYASGEYHSSSDYSKIIEDRRGEFKKRMKAAPGAMTSIFQSIFGSGHAEKEFDSTAEDFLDKDKMFARKKASSSNSSGFLSSLFNPLKNEYGFVDPGGKYTNVSSSEDVTAGMDQNEEREEKKKRDGTRKTTKHGFEEIIKLLKRGFGAGSAGDEKKPGFFKGLLGKIGSIAGSIFNFAKIAVPVLAGLKIFTKLNELRSDGGSSEPGTGAFGKATDTKARLIKAALVAGGHKGAEFVGKHADDIAMGGGAAAIKAGAKASGTKGAGIAAGKVAGKAGLKVGGAVTKTVLKKVPFLGALIGTGLAVGRVFKGDFAGAGMEFVSGLTSFVPGPGWAVGLAIDAAILARDIARARSDGGEITPELQARAESINKSAKANLSKRAYAMFGDQLDKLKDLADSGELKFNKKDKKWYTKDEAAKLIKDGSAGFTTKKGLLGGLMGKLGGMFDRGKPKEDAGDGLEWKRVDHMFGSTWEKVPSTRSSKLTQYQTLTETDEDRAYAESQKPKSLLRKMFDWHPVGMVAKGLKHTKKQWGEAFGAIGDAYTAYTDYAKRQAKERWDKMINGVKGWFTSVWDGAKNFIGDKIKRAIDLAKKVGSALYEGLGIKKMVDWGKGLWDRTFGEGAGEDGPGMFGRAKNWISEHTPAALIKKGANAIERKYSGGVKSEDRKRLQEIHRQRLDTAKEGKDGWVQTADGEWEREVTKTSADLRRHPGETDSQFERRIRITGKDVDQGKMDFGYGTESIYNPTVKKIVATNKKRKLTEQDQRRNAIAAIKAKDSRVMARSVDGGKSEAIVPIGPDVIGLNKDMQNLINQPKLEDEYFSKAVPFNQRKATPKQMSEASNAVTTRPDEELPSVKEKRRAEAQVKIPSHSSAPSAINTGMSPSKSAVTKNRPINPMMEGFIEGLFANTITSLQQSIKSFAIGQTPFQILR